MLPEAVPPFHEPTPAPAPAPVSVPKKRAPAPAPAPARPAAPADPTQAPTPTPIPLTPQASGVSLSPSLQSSASPLALRQEPAGSPAAPLSGGSLAALAALLDKQQDKTVGLMREEREVMEAKMERMEAQRAEMQALLEQERSEKEKMAREAAVTEATRPKLATEVITDEQLSTLQARLQGFHEVRC